MNLILELATSDTMQPIALLGSAKAQIGSDIDARMPAPLRVDTRAA